MKNKRAMVMIFVVVMMVSVTTILAAGVDLGRLAVYKQKQLEREAKWRYCVDSAKAFVVGDLFVNANYSQSFSQIVNGIGLTITCNTDSWNDNGCKMTVAGTIDGKARSSSVNLGKRATTNPCQFGMFFTSTLPPLNSTNLTGDLYYGGTLSGSYLNVTGNVYSPDVSAPSLASLSGSYIGRQPRLSIDLNDQLYYNNASVRTSGDQTLTSPTNLLSLSRSQLRYHEGDLTIKGTVTGEITIFVKGSVTINAVSVLTTIISRLVVICDGDIYFDKGDSYVFAICNGTLGSSSSSGERRIYGSVAAKNFVATKNDPYTVVFDNYFVSYPGGGERYRIPGQW